MTKKGGHSAAAKSFLEAAEASADRPTEVAESVGAADADFVAAVTGYTTSIVRTGANLDFLGWIALVGDQGTPVAYVYLRESLVAPHLSSGKDYVVFDWPPEHLEALLAILRSGEPLRVRYSGDYAFLEHR